MSKELKKPVVKGMVIEALPATTFKVKLESGEEIIAYLSGKMRLNYIKILPSDRVLLELSPDGKRGRIIRRL
ncbi:translation initiation factor IF-1 [Candidatus Wolfebacteria bacterium]|nr:translation initiation factor IF-1 [Candidatus Wolfebacteria bacterium]